MSDEQYMQMAMAEASQAAAAGDVPVGAVIVIGERVVGRGRNQREQLGDPTAHAEIQALRDAALNHVGHWRIEGTIYVTQEPCPMCAGALVNARIRRLVFGCDNPKAGAVRTFYQIPTDSRLNHRMDVASGVLASECGGLLTRFFAQLRNK
jgi:tRNA(adenine34) deaminase